METKIVKGFGRTPINYTYSFVGAIIFTIITALTSHFDVIFIGFSVQIMMEEVDPTTGYFPVLLLLSALNGCTYGLFIYWFQRERFFEDFDELQKAWSRLDIKFLPIALFPVLMMIGVGILMVETIFIFAIVMITLFLLMFGLILVIIGTFSSLLAFGTVFVFEFLVFPFPNRNIAIFSLAGVYMVLYLLWWQKARKKKGMSGIYGQESIVSFKSPTTLIQTSDLFIVGSGRDIQLYSADGKLLYKLTGHKGKVSKLYYEQEHLYSFDDENNEIGIWSLGLPTEFVTSYRQLTINPKASPQDLLVNHEYVVIVFRRCLEIFDHNHNHLRHIDLDQDWRATNVGLLNHHIYHLDNTDEVSRLLVWDLTSKIDGASDSIELDQSYQSLQIGTKYIRCVDEKKIAIYTAYPDFERLHTFERSDEQQLVDSTDPVLCLQETLSEKNEVYENQFYELPNKGVGELIIAGEVKKVIAGKYEYLLLLEHNGFLRSKGQVIKLSVDKLSDNNDQK